MKRGLQHTHMIPGHLIGQLVPVITVDMECPDCEGAGLVINHLHDDKPGFYEPDVAVICHCVKVERRRVL